MAEPARKERVLDTTDPLVGSVVYENNVARYTVLGCLGRGGMGEVFLAFDKQTNSEVAIKLITEELSKKDDMRDRFFIEVKACMHINADHVIRTMGFGLFRNRLYSVMECLDGTDLDKIKKSEGRLTWSRLQPIISQMCEGVHAAHSHELKILHRDLKPSNIFIIDREGKEYVKVLDFGLAKMKSDQQSELTMAGMILGSVSYIAPEMIPETVKDKKECDQRVDVYAAGVIMYELLTGVLPFRGESVAETLYMHKHVPPQPPREIIPDIPPKVERIILKCMEKDRNKRFNTMEELGQAIAGLTGKSESGDMIIGDIMQPPPAASPQEAEGAKIMSEVRAIADTSKEKKKPSGYFGRFVKAASIAAVIGGGIWGYTHQDAIKGWSAELKARYDKEVTPPTPKPEQVPVPQPSATVEVGYIVNIDTTPSAASVFELKQGSKTGLYISSTPLRIRLPEGDHTLLIRKKGYEPKTVVVTKNRSTLNETLAKTPKKPTPAPTPSEDNTNEDTSDDQQ